MSNIAGRLRRREFVGLVAAGGAVLAVGALASLAAENAPIEIDCKFPGGNIIVDKVEGDDVFIRQDLRDTAGHWFYWCFRVRGAAGRTLTFHFTQGDVLTHMGPCCSLDGGHTWKWLGAEAVRSAPAAKTDPAKKPPPGPAFSFTFPADAEDVRFCLAIPYQESDLRAFLARHPANAALKAAVLCRTQKSREAEVLYLGRMDGRPDYRLAFTCRHHSCESVANYVLEGLMEAVLADDETGRWFRDHASILAVPFVDKDGVEDGDQGKNRKPRDHNRDYGEGTLYPTVAAIKKLLPEWSAGRLDVAIDLHCPSVKDDYIGFIGGPEPEFWERALRLSAILKETQKGPLVFDPADNVPFGKAWNTGTGTQMSFASWARTLPGVSVATTIETAYAQLHKTPMTADGARAFGRDLAAALRLYLEKELPR